MQRTEGLPTVVAAPGRLAVDGIDGLIDLGRLGCLLTQRLQPGGEAGLKGGRVKQRQHPGRGEEFRLIQLNASPATFDLPNQGGSIIHVKGCLKMVEIVPELVEKEDGGSP